MDDAKRRRLDAKDTDCGADSAESVVHVWLVRHAETENNELHRRLGVKRGVLGATRDQYHRERLPDPGLTQLGVEQVAKLPEHPALKKLLCPQRPVQLFASPFSRAIQTAAPLQRILMGTPRVILKPELAEIGGLYRHVDDRLEQLPGMTPEELNRAFPDIVLDASEVSEKGWWADAEEEDPENCKSAGGCPASWSRVEAVAKWIRQLPPGDVVIVGHGLFFGRLVPTLLGTSRNVIAEHGNTAVTHLELNGGSTNIHCVNAMSAVAN